METIGNWGERRSGLNQARGAELPQLALQPSETEPKGSFRRALPGPLRGLIRALQAFSKGVLEGLYRVRIGVSAWLLSGFRLPSTLLLLFCSVCIHLAFALFSISSASPWEPTQCYTLQHRGLSMLVLATACCSYMAHGTLRTLS